MKANAQQQLLSAPEKIYDQQYCQSLLETLISIVDWQQDFVAFGRRFDIPRLQAWYADEGIHYRYSDNKLQSHAWIEPLLTIKQDVEAHTGHTFNSVLLTYYRTGDDHVSWHADDEKELGDAPVIASLSLGGSRVFHYRHKENELAGHLELHDGELLVMQPDFQRYWQHCIPPQAYFDLPRLNLTFRRVVMLGD